MKRAWFALLCATLVTVATSFAATDEDLAARVIIVANSRQTESVRLAEFYADKRRIPRANIIALPMPEAEGVTWREFIDQVYQPLQDALFARDWFDGAPTGQLDQFGRKRYRFVGNKISYLVTCRGVPLRIFNDPTMLDETKRAKIPPIYFTNQSSVDSELSLLAQSDYDPVAMAPNPFYNNPRVALLDAESIVKVSRLDGPSWDSARHLVTSALEAEKQGLIGRAYLDIGGPHREGDQWLEAVGSQIKELGFDATVDRNGSMLGADGRIDAPALYFGWYTGSVNGPFALPEMRFAPGAIALHIHSFSAPTLRSDTAGWVAPFVAHGAAVTMGNVNEPYLQLTHRPHLFLGALMRGETVGDAFYFSLSALSWQSVAIGDPLYRPFKVSFEQQEKNAKILPGSLGTYVMLRRANLLQQEGRLSAAVALLKAAMQERPDFALSVALAKAHLALGSKKEAVDTLAFLALMPNVRPMDWGILREAAALLAANDARPVALKIYTTLSRSKPPSRDALTTVVTEAKAVADAAQDMAQSLAFGRLLIELTPPPVTLPPATVSPH